MRLHRLRARSGSPNRPFPNTALFLLAQLRLLLPQTRQNIRIPPLPNIRMTLDPIPQRRLTQRLRHAPLTKRKLNIIQPPPTPRQHLLPLLPHMLGDLPHPDVLEVVEPGVAADALEEGDREARALARRRRQHPVRRADTHALRERLEPLPDGHHERAGDGRAVDPVAAHVLYLEALVLGGLEEVGGEHWYWGI